MPLSAEDSEEHVLRPGLAPTVCCKLLPVVATCHSRALTGGHDSRAEPGQYEPMRQGLEHVHP